MGNLNKKAYIELKNVSRDFGEFKLRHINLKIYENEYFIVLGPTGAGKTLLLELIAGFHNLDDGIIRINQKNMKNIQPYERNIGFVYQDYSLFPHMSVEKNIAFGLNVQNKASNEIKTKVMEIMDKLEINHLKERSPKTLSGGEQQKVALARALIVNPKILLLDEPFSALDPITKKDAMKVVKQIHEDHNLTIIEVTHNQDEAMLGDRLSLIMNGEIIDTGTPKEVFNSPKNKTVANFVGVENILEGEIIKNENGYAEVKTESFKVHCLSKFDSGKVVLFIRPENVVLSKSLFKSSIRNNIKTKVKDMLVISKELIQITLENGIKAYITFSAREDLNLEIGDEIYASFKATAVSLKR
ncbi:MAG: Molybdate/tungstate import ATP-binding protein WtpC [Promethearchaeota archaeon]|nr:MAG: Molybdate/tungstate import ATP-binding protein WtpC [Candidatus Lokiarchaeota archaeon]